MRIDRLTLTNFKCFAAQSFDLHPQFTLFVGDNGSGKSSILDGLAVAAGSWLLGFRGYDTRPIRRPDVKVSAKPIVHDGTFPHDASRRFGDVTWEEHFPCAVRAYGEIFGQRMEWSPVLRGWPGRTSYSEAKELKALAQGVGVAAKEGDALLPLIASYGTCRLCSIPRDNAVIKDERPLMDKNQLSRFSGYRSSLDRRVDVGSFVRWIARQTWISFQRGGEHGAAFDAVQQAVVSCLPEARQIHFDPLIGEVVVDFGEHGMQPFNNQLRQFVDGDTGTLVGLESYLRRLERLADAPDEEEDL